MTHSIVATNGAGSASPYLVENYAHSLESRSHFHDTLDGGIGFAFVAPRPGSGPITLVFKDRASAFAALNLHKLGAQFTWTPSEVPEAAMTYAVDGNVTISGPDLGLWRVQIDCRTIT